MKCLLKLKVEANGQTWEVEETVSTEKLFILANLMRLAVDLTGAWTSDVGQEDLSALSLTLVPRRKAASPPKINS